MYRLVCLLAAVAMTAACGDNKAAPEDAAPPPGDAAPTALQACLDQSTELSRPPTGQLPCELLPPGFGP
jgi:hypothetical protein